MGQDDHVQDIVCPLHLSLECNVEYNLVGRIIFLPNPSGVGHFKAQIRVGDNTYLCDDLERDGMMVNLGPLYKLEEYNKNTVCVLYVRTSSSVVCLFISINFPNADLCGH